MPELKFKFDPKYDCEIAWNFYDKQKYGGVNFWEKGALQYHDELIAIKKASDKKSFLNRKKGQQIFQKKLNKAVRFIARLTRKRKISPKIWQEEITI